MQDHTIAYQIGLIQAAMQDAGVWTDESPEWVRFYSGEPTPDIWQWLQFIYLPMRLAISYQCFPYLAPQLQSHLENNPKLSPLLQLTIELDSITPTIHL